MHRVGDQQRIGRTGATKTDGSNVLNFLSVKLASNESRQILLGADFFQGQRKLCGSHFGRFLCQELRLLGAGKATDSDERQAEKAVSCNTAYSSAENVQEHFFDDENPAK